MGKILQLVAGGGAQRLGLVHFRTKSFIALEFAYEYHGILKLFLKRVLATSLYIEGTVMCGSSLVWTFTEEVSNHPRGSFPWLFDLSDLRLVP